MPLRVALLLALVVGPAVGGYAGALKILPVTPAAPAPVAPAVTRASVTVTPGLVVQPGPVTLPPASTSINPNISPNLSTGSPAVPLPTDPLWPRQWDMQAIAMPEAWALWRSQPVTGQPVTVAVLDTGFVASPELRGRVINGYDFVRDPLRAGDGSGRDPDASGVGAFAYHAELVGNIIAAAHDGQGMAGINPQARIVQIRVAGTDGMIDPVDLVDALRWSVGLKVAGVPTNPNPARIINLSLYADFIPLTGCDSRIQKAIDDVAAKGALVVAGAANDGKEASGYSPAGCRNVLTVTSVDGAGQRPSYANWGRSVALAAPGGEVGHGVVASSITGVGGERSPNGTSFAAPHVAGVASLLLSVRPGLAPAALRDLLTRSATPFAAPCDPDPRKTCGSGVLNARAALAAALDYLGK